LVRHFFSVFVTHNVDGNDVIFILSCRWGWWNVPMYHS
jgi:hypothetical protein